MRASEPCTPLGTGGQPRREGWAGRVTAQRCTGRVCQQLGGVGEADVQGLPAAMVSVPWARLTSCHNRWAVSAESGRVSRLQHTPGRSARPSSARGPGSPWLQRSQRPAPLLLGSPPPGAAALSRAPFLPPLPAPQGRPSSLNLRPHREVTGAAAGLQRVCLKHLHLHEP